MRVFNRFRVTQRAAYVIVELGFSISEDKNDLGEQLEVFTLPITSSASLAVDLFRATAESSVDLTEYFLKVTERIQALNALSPELEKRKQAAVEAAGLSKGGEPPKDAAPGGTRDG